MLDAYEMFLDMENKNIILSFKGEITSDIISNVLNVAENKFENISEKVAVRKKIFNILIEGLQNLYHHTEDFPIDSQQKYNSKSALLLVWYENNTYSILTGNYIENKKIPPLKNHIDKINSLSKEELRSFYRKTLSEKDISKKGGAGLGLIDIARKSHEKINYEFKTVNDKISFFSITVKVANN